MEIGRQARRAGGLAAALCACALAQAQIRVDASLGRVPQSLTGPQFLIPESLGSLRGINLFHSFSAFNIASGESATFTTATRGIGNVISRVTGGDASLINGPLRLQAADGAPGFFFINPAGVTFGAGAAIDVPGAFHVSTADYVKFADGVFHASPNAPSTLSSAPPEAFGFLGSTRASINVNGGARLNAALLQPFSIVAGDVAMDNGRVTTEGGDIRVVALGGTPAEVAFRGPLPQARGALAIRDGGQLFSRTNTDIDAGSVTVSAGSILLDRGDTTALTGIVNQANKGSSGNAGAINVAASGDLVIQGGVIAADTFASGNAGDVRVSAANILLDRGPGAGFAGIESSAAGLIARAGHVVVETSGLLTIRNGASILSNTNGAGAAGSVTVRAGDMVLDGLNRKDFVTAVGSNADPGSSGPAGSVEVEVARTLSIFGGGQISSSTFARGDAGSVRVVADSILIDRRGSPFFATGIFSAATEESAGNAGVVDVVARSIVINPGGGDIASTTRSVGNAGRVRVEADTITMDGTVDATISSAARTDASGNAGSVEVIAHQLLSMRNGATISSNTYGDGNAGTVAIAAGEIDIGRYGAIVSATFGRGNAGSVKVTANRMRVDAEGPGEFLTGITTQSDSDSSGNAGSVDVSVSGRLELAGGGEISSSTFGTGNAGTVNVAAGEIQMTGGSVIISDTFGPGRAGAVDVRADTMVIDAAGEVGGIFSRAREGSTGDAGRVDVRVNEELSILRGAEIASSTFGEGNAGTVKVTARNLILDGQDDSSTGIFSQAERASTGNAGRIEVNALEDLRIAAAGRISSGTFSSGNGGAVEVTARNVIIDGMGRATGITSSTGTGSTGNAGVVRISTTEDVTLINGGQITSSTQGGGNAGSVTVAARNLVLDSQGGTGGTGIFSQATPSSRGNAGAIEVDASGSLTISNGALISSATFADGHAGFIRVSADRLHVDGGEADTATGISSDTVRGKGNAGNVEVFVRDITLLNDGEIASGSFAGGNAGTVRVEAGTIRISSGAGIFSQSQSGSSGDAGAITVVASGDISLSGGGVITSSTLSAGNAGSVKVTARNIAIDGEDSFRITGILSQSDYSSTGNAGSVEVSATGDIDIARSGLISSDAFSDGVGGTVKVTADNITISGAGESFRLTGIVSRAGFYSAGAGSVDVTAANRLDVLAGGQISSSTDSYRGAAGSVVVRAADLRVDGRDAFEQPSSINALATQYSGGQVGNVTVIASRSLTLSGGGELSITNAATSLEPDTIQPSRLLVRAPIMDLSGGSTITAASSANVAASDVQVEVGSRLVLTGSSITTSAVDGNGGSIAIIGDGALFLRDSQVTTSVSGTAGNGGDIFIGTRGLVLSTGFIQANTAAADASGGNVRIDTASLIPSGNTIFVGGQTPLEFIPGVFGANVIQAAAPTGVSGAIRITTPALDISGGLVGLTAKVLDSGGLGRSLCEMTGGSSLALAGRGGMPPSARDFARAETPLALPSRVVLAEADFTRRFECWR